MKAKKNDIQEKINRPNNFVMRREEIARLSEAAFHEKGYVQTSLRDIANHTGISLGSLTYHFGDRSDLVQFCARQYKLSFIKEIETLCKKAVDTESLVKGFIKIVVNAVVNDSKTHSLWYQAKSEALFDDTFYEMVTEIELKLQEVVAATLAAAEKLSGDSIDFDRLQAYWLLDNMFQHYLLEQVNEHAKVKNNFRKALKKFFEKTLGF